MAKKIKDYLKNYIDNITNNYLLSLIICAKLANIKITK